ncbi:hypothetical protein FQA39_LY12950 [Lamprigera yunnana]|nr:hypothetical protein FQA39_LY12950 [Lamprigera yunnana]
MYNYILSVIQELNNKRQAVTVFDIDQEKLDLYLSGYDSIDAIVLDVTNKKGLSKNGINSYDEVIVAIGRDIEVSLLTVLNLIDLQCEKIIVQAKDLQHKRILLSLGLSDNQIIIPDYIAGAMIGTRATFDIDFDIDFHPIDDNYLTTILKVTNPSIFNKIVQDVGLSTNKEFSLIQLRRNGKIILIDDYTELKEDDEIVTFARTTIINKLAEKIQGAIQTTQETNQLKDFEELESLGTQANADDVTFFNVFDNIQETTSNEKKTKKIIKQKTMFRNLVNIFLQVYKMFFYKFNGIPLGYHF